MKREENTTISASAISNMFEIKRIKTSSLGLMIASLVGYHLLFWNESFGFNTLLFTAVILLWNTYHHRKSVHQKPLLASGIITILLSVMIVVNGSYLAKFSYLCSFLIYLGFLFQPNAKSIISALPSGLLNFPVSFINTINQAVKQVKIPKKFSGVTRFLKFTLIPLAVLILFIIIYSYANPIFNDLTFRFLEKIGNAISAFFAQLSFSWICFLIMGVIVILGVSRNGNIHLFADQENSCSENILRKRVKRFGKTKPLGLKDENKTAILLMGLVNLLLLVINGIDIQWIWLNFSLTGSQTYAQLVHEGTYLLILSILISMGIVFYYFRKNQNFYSQNRMLKSVSYLWIAQNILLAMSVAIRNIRYIDHYGLTYKRIGVLVFLIMTCIGLVTLFLKVKNGKTSYYVVKINAWALYLLLFGLSVFNWDVIVVSHNLNMPDSAPIDKSYLLTFSDKTLPILYVYATKFIERGNKATYMDSDYRMMSYLDKINERIRDYKYDEDLSEKTWLSWDYADYQTQQFFK
jgi:hypothetical protein